MNYAKKMGFDFWRFLNDDKTEQVHFIGKDIVYFHTLFWPAMLNFAGRPYRVPDNVFVHGFMTVDGRKMSKSYGNVIPLFEDDKAIKKAIFSIKTDSRPMEEPKNPDEILVYEIYKSIAKPEQLKEMGEGLRQGKLGYGHIKNMLLDAVIAEVSQAREKYNYYMSHFAEVEEMLEDGAAKARPVAKATLKRLKDAVFGR